MSVTIESDLKEILAKFEQKLDKLDTKLDTTSERIEKKIDKLDQKIDGVTKDLGDLKVSVARLEGELKGDIKTVDANP
jgi:predicted RNase H-like nuclease (RuvC/YqgF family)